MIRLLQPVDFGAPCPIWHVYVLLKCVIQKVLYRYSYIFIWIYLNTHTLFIFVSSLPVLIFRCIPECTDLSAGFSECVFVYKFIVYNKTYLNQMNVDSTKLWFKKKNYQISIDFNYAILMLTLTALNRNLVKPVKFWSLNIYNMLWIQDALVSRINIFFTKL